MTVIIGLKSMDATYVNAGVQLMMIGLLCMVPGNVHFLFGSEGRRQQYKREIYFFVYLPLAIGGLNALTLITYALSEPIIAVILVSGIASGGLFFY